MDPVIIGDRRQSSALVKSCGELKEMFSVKGKLSWRPHNGSVEMLSLKQGELEFGGHLEKQACWRVLDSTSHGSTQIRA